MTDLSEVTQFSDKSSDCQSGPHNAITSPIAPIVKGWSNKTSPPQRPPKIRAVEPYKPVKRDGYFSPEPAATHVRICGYNAARVLAYLLFRYQPDESGPRLSVFKYGCYWWVQDRASMARDCGLTEDQFRTAMDRLKALNLVVSERHRYHGPLAKYQDKTVLHHKLTVARGSAALDGWPSEAELLRMIPGGDFPPTLTVGIFPQDKEKEEVTTKKVSKNSQYEEGDVLNIATATPVEPKLLSGKGDANPKETIDLKKYIPEYGETPEPKTKLQQIKESWSEQQKQDHVSGVHHDWDAWVWVEQQCDMDALLAACRGRYSEIGEKRRMFSPAEARVLRDIEQRRREIGLDDTLPELLTCLADHWETGWKNVLQTSDDLAHVPAGPTLRNIRRHLTRWWKLCANAAEVNPA